MKLPAWPPLAEAVDKTPRFGTSLQKHKILQTPADTMALLPCGHTSRNVAGQRNLGGAELGKQVSQSLGVCTHVCCSAHPCVARVVWALLARIKIMKVFRVP